MFNLFEKDYYDPRETIVFIPQQLGEEKTTFLLSLPEKTDNQYRPTITFKKINPTHYQVKVENAKAPFFLVFSESYDTQWKAYAEDKGIEFKEIIVSYKNVNVKEAKPEMKFTPSDILYLFAKQLPDDNHFIVNGYANAWYINPKEIDKNHDGNFTITLYFWPQSLFYLGLFISGTTLLGCLGYLGYDWRKRKREMVLSNKNKKMNNF
jgi:hypothetical protein